MGACDPSPSLNSLERNVGKKRSRSEPCGRVPPSEASHKDRGARRPLDPQAKRQRNKPRSERPRPGDARNAVLSEGPPHPDSGPNSCRRRRLVERGSRSPKSSACIRQTILMTTWPLLPDRLSAPQTSASQRPNLAQPRGGHLLQRRHLPFYLGVHALLPRARGLGPLRVDLPGGGHCRHR